jgi:radical SAM protein (TIGR01212 family)
MAKALYTQYGAFLRDRYGQRVQKISLNLDAGCPNRSRASPKFSGCAYCRVDSFTPAYCLEGAALEDQWRSGLAFFERKAPDQRFLAFLQTYSNLAGSCAEFEDILTCLFALPQIAGIVIATRPDIINNEKALLLKDVARRARSLGLKTFCVELGLQSFRPESLELMNRGHGIEASFNALELLADEVLEIGVHLIWGLPDEDAQYIRTQAKVVNSLPIRFLKIHHLQVLEGTAYELLWKAEAKRFPDWNPREYLELCIDFIEHIRPDLVIERFCNESPPNMVLHPSWYGLRNYTFSQWVEQGLQERGTWQGKYI